VEKMADLMEGVMKMFVHNGGTAVHRGMYWSPVDGRGIHMRDNGILPGDTSRGYLRISPVILLVLAPLFGTTFVFFLPLFGIGVMIVLCLLWASGVLSSLTATAVRVCCRSGARRPSQTRRVFTGAYRPLRASFTGAAKGKKKSARMK
jgi:hypothetical protein